MLTAHLPAGYLTGTYFQNRLFEGPVITAALIGGLAPDIDMLAFHFVDHGTVHHHVYMTHWPLFWLVLLSPVILYCHFKTHLLCRNAVTAFLAAVIVHLVLDTIAGPIFWFKPFSDLPVELVEVPAARGHWILSFLMHWTFALEIGVWVLAYVSFRRCTCAPHI